MKIGHTSPFVTVRLHFGKVRYWRTLSKGHKTRDGIWHTTTGYLWLAVLQGSSPLISRACEYIVEVIMVPLPATYLQSISFKLLTQTFSNAGSFLTWKMGVLFKLWTSKTNNFVLGEPDNYIDRGESEFKVRVKPVSSFKTFSVVYSAGTSLGFDDRLQ